jgi:acyl carrier protein
LTLAVSVRHAPGKDCGTDVDLEQLLRDVIVKICAVAPAQVQRGSTLEDLGIDSLAVAEIIVELEIHLDRELPIDMLRRLDRIRTVGDVLDELPRALGTSEP